MPPRPRGRPRQFQADEALEKAAAHFLRTGLHDATLAELSNSLGIAKPSLYGAFGDKRALYQQAAAAYAAAMTRAIEGRLARAGSLREAVRALFAGALAVYAPEDGPHLGCLVATTMATAAGTDTGLRDWLRAFLEDSDAMLADYLAARFPKELQRRGLTAAQAAGTLNAALHSLAIRARAGTSGSALAEVAETAEFLLCGPAGGAQSGA